MPWSPIAAKRWHDGVMRDLGMWTGSRAGTSVGVHAEILTASHPVCTRAAIVSKDEMVRPMPVRGSAGKYTSQSGMPVTSDIGSGWAAILQSKRRRNMDAACPEPWNSSGMYHII